MNNLRLSGFDETQTTIAKRVTDSFAKHIVKQVGDVEEISIHRKDIHGSKHEVNVRIYQNGKRFTTEVVDHNLWTALDQAQRKVEAIMK